MHQVHSHLPLIIKAALKAILEVLQEYPTVSTNSNWPMMLHRVSIMGIMLEILCQLLPEERTLEETQDHLMMMVSNIQIIF